MTCTTSRAVSGWRVMQLSKGIVDAATNSVCAHSPSSTVARLGLDYSGDRLDNAVRLWFPAYITEPAVRGGQFLSNSRPIHLTIVPILVISTCEATCECQTSCGVARTDYTLPNYTVVTI